MAKRRVKLSIERHRELGRELFNLRNYLGNLILDLHEHLPKAKLRRLHKAQDHIDGLRCVLDSMLAQDHSDSFDTHVYYPGSQERVVGSALAEAVRPPKTVTRFDEGVGAVVVDGCRDGYRVDITRLHSAPVLLGWIEHLAEKSWITPKHLRELIRHAECRNAVKVDRCL